MSGTVTNLLGRAATATAIGGAGFAAYVLAGYPALSIAASRLKGEHTPPPLAELPPVTLIVCAHNEAKHIEGRLDNIAELNYPRDLLQVIVSDDGSTDGTADLAEAHPYDAEVVRNWPRGGKCSAINAGVARARHDVLAFSDAENAWHPDALVELVKWLGDPTVGAVNGRHVPVGGGDDVEAGEGAYWKYDQALKKAEANLGSLTSILGSQLVVRREVMPTLPTEGVANDDLFIGLSVAHQGYRVAFAPRATSSESGSQSLKDDSKRRVRMANGRWKLLRHWRQLTPKSAVVTWQVISHKYLRLLLPVGMGAAVAGTAGALASGTNFRTPTMWTLAVGQAGAYGLAAAAPHLDWAPKPVQKAAKVARYAVQGNKSTLDGLWRAMQPAGSSTHMWQRVEKDALR